MLKTQKHNQGFTLIELVIVIVLLGLLAAFAIPRFLDVTEDAEDATTEGVAGGFATGVGLVRAQWEIEARPEDNQSEGQSFVTIEGIQIGIDGDTGYPTGQLQTGSTEDTDMTALDCESLFGLIMQSAPTITSVWSANIGDDFRYFTNVQQGAGIGGNDTCRFYLVQTVKNLTSEPLTTTVGNGFIYDPRIGQVRVFSNNQSNN